jgi:hypothetical protein
MVDRLLVRLIGIFIILFFVSPVIADETIQGHYCYTYGDRETIQEAREVVRTLSIRNGIESYRVFIESSTKVKNFSLTNDLVQIVSSGYLKNLKVLEHTEEGRTICEKISGTLKPEEIEKVLKREVEKRTKTIEEKGIDNNGYIKILRIYLDEEKYYRGPVNLHVVCSVLTNITCSKSFLSKPESQIFITYHDRDGNPFKSDKKSLCTCCSEELYRDEIVHLTFLHSPVYRSYKVWLYHDRTSTNTSTTQKVKKQKSNRQ